MFKVSPHRSRTSLDHHILRKSWKFSETFRYLEKKSELLRNLLRSSQIYQFPADLQLAQVLTVNPSLVSCLKLQHRAAPTERNLVNALRVATGDWKAPWPPLEGSQMVPGSRGTEDTSWIPRIPLDPLYRCAMDFLLHVDLRYKNTDHEKR